MGVGSTSTTTSSLPCLSPLDRILQRLIQCGVPMEQVNQLQPGLVSFVKENKAKLTDVVYAILPTEDEIFDASVDVKAGLGGASSSVDLENIFTENILWLQWLMFENEPGRCLKNLSENSVGQRGVCGAVWGKRSIAYRCKTCEFDPTCAICGPCFHNGNHKDHDYSVIYTKGGYCDCGDETAWKREGFCSKHKGTEQIQPVPEEIAHSVGPVLDVLRTYWEENLLLAQAAQQGSLLNGDYVDDKVKVSELTSAVVEMLLEFCEYNGSLFSFVSRRLFLSANLLDVLVRAESFLYKAVTKRLHELLVKLLGDPVLKYEFAKVFLVYYPDTIKVAIKERSDAVLKKYPLVSNFSVQIFTVPTLAPRLVREMNLLGIVFRCLEDLFRSCAGKKGHLKVSKWASLYKTTCNLMLDVSYIVSHVEVAKYIIHEQRNLSVTWMRLLAFVQGMDLQKRVTGIHVEEENENVHFPFVLGNYIADIHALLVNEAFSVEEMKSGRSTTSDGDTQMAYDDIDNGIVVSVPSTVTWLTCECLKAIENWLRCNVGSLDPLNSSSQDFSSRTETMGVLSMSDWPHIAYDVSSEDISVHIPLHRLLSLLLHKALKKCYGETGVLETRNPCSAYPPLSGDYHDFFRHVLRGCKPFGFSAYVMEHPLRVKVFCAQVHAGMWRKNGDEAMLNYCEYYQSVWGSEQGLELDIFLLQCCATLAPPDLFVKRIVERFGLSNYISLNLEQSNEYEPVLVQEMLTLIIQIVKERRFCGLSPAESLRRELVYKLAIGDATRSQLVESLPKDLSKTDQLQMILDSVADYSKPSGTKQGIYSLRKTCWEQMDLYHPRWDFSDLQAAEERYMRACNVSAWSVQLPRWTEVFYPLNGISKLATSRALLEIVRAVLFYAVFAEKLSQSRTPDGVVLVALHLLSLGLDICYLQRQTVNQSRITESSYNLEEDTIPLLAFASEEISVGATNGYGAGKHKSLLSLLVSLMRIHKTETCEQGQCNRSSLISYLLKKFAELHVGCMTELQILAPEVVSHLLHPIPNADVHKSGSISDADERKLMARARQAAIMEKMRVAQSKFLESLESEESDDFDVSKSEQLQFNSDNSQISEELAPVVCSLCRDPNSKIPLSFLILLQKSRLASFVDRGPLSWEQAHPSDKGRSSSRTDEGTDRFGSNILASNLGSSSVHLLQLVQNTVNEFSHDALPGEVDGVLEFIKTQLPVTRNVQRPSTSYDTRMDASSSIEMMEVDIYQSILKDMQDVWEHSNVIKDNKKFSTDASEEGITKNKYAESTLLGKYIASLSRETPKHSLVSKNSRRGNASPKTPVLFPAVDGFGPTDCSGIHISSCGHAVHQECRDRYFPSLRKRKMDQIQSDYGYSRTVFEGELIVDPDQGEFLCPVCRRLTNSVLPAFPDDSSKVGKQMTLSGFSSETTIGSSVTSGTSVLRLAQALSLLQSAGDMVGKSGMHRDFSLHRSKKMHPTLQPVFNILSRMFFPDRHETFLASRRISHSMILWDTLKYSVISTEIAARGGRSNMSAGSSTSGLEALYRDLESSSGFILSLVLRVVQNTRSEDSLQELLRFRGIQLFAHSICSGVSTDEIAADTDDQKGNISSVLKYVDKEVDYPDIQFWRRAADPVLARDPFSSLMWILFSLPSPFLSSAECFLCLVHLFYVVCVIQALMTYSRKHQIELGFGDCLISDFRKIAGGYAFAQQYFVSNCIDDSSCHPKDIIRRLSHPYLRRCALLWKLLKFPTPAFFSDGSYEGNRLSSSMNNVILECPTALSVELKEVEELEHMFKVPDLDVIVNDKMLRALGSIWFHHICSAYKTRNHGLILHTTPAIPFSLMRLPHVYQDLLERYIKKNCPECGAVQDDPALCLLCGRICSSQNSCCRESECQTHAKSCGAGIGVYLLIRRTTILLQRSARQAHWPSPYLDAFGEEDIEIKRGKPLYLHEERYAALTNMVASHELDRNSEVHRETKVVHDLDYGII